MLKFLLYPICDEINQTNVKKYNKKQTAYIFTKICICQLNEPKPDKKKPQGNN